MSRAIGPNDQLCQGAGKELAEHHVQVARWSMGGEQHVAAEDTRRECHGVQALRLHVA